MTEIRMPQPSRVNWALFQGLKVRFTQGVIRVGANSRAMLRDL